MTEFVISGPVVLAAALSLLAGLVSFASPCCLPLVPGYLAYLAGMSGADATAPSEAAPASRRRLMLAAGLFVAGFTAVFTAAAAVVLGVSDALLRNEALLQRVGGIVTVVMGLAFLGWIPSLQREFRIHRLPRAGLAGAPMLGAVFGLGWTPCLGPTLTGVISLAAGTDTSLRGIALVLAYSAGLGVPFLLLALGARWTLVATDRLRRHVRQVQLLGGALLLVIGTLLVTGAWGAFVNWLRGPIAGFTLPI